MGIYIYIYIWGLSISSYPFKLLGIKSIFPQRCNSTLTRTKNKNNNNNNKNRNDNKKINSLTPIYLTKEENRCTSHSFENSSLNGFMRSHN